MGKIILTQYEEALGLTVTINSNAHIIAVGNNTLL